MAEMLQRVLRRMQQLLRRSQQPVALGGIRWKLILSLVWCVSCYERLLTRFNAPYCRLLTLIDAY